MLHMYSINMYSRNKLFLDSIYLFISYGISSMEAILQQMWIFLTAGVKMYMGKAIKQI